MQKQWKDEKFMQQFSRKSWKKYALGGIKKTRKNDTDENVILIEVLCEGVDRSIWLRVLLSGGGGGCEHVYGN